MARRSGLFLLALGSVAGVVLGRRFFSRSAERAELHLDNGSMISLEGDASAAQGLFRIARDIVDIAGR